MSDNGRKILLTAPIEWLRRTSWGTPIEVTASIYGLDVLEANIDTPHKLLRFPTWEEYIDCLKSGEFTDVGISFLLNHTDIVEEMIRKTREISDVKIVGGGHGAFNRKPVNEMFDGVSTGWGVEWLKEWLGEAVNTPPYRLPVSDLEFKFGPVDTTIGSIVGNAGCPFGCDFCHIQLHEFTDTTSSFAVAVSSDDYYWTVWGTPTFNNSAILIYLGQPTAGTEWAGGFRFPNVDIQQGATIINAYLRVQAHWTDGGTCDVNVFGNDVDNAVAPTSKSQADALALTSNYDNVILGAWSAGTWYNINCTQAVQEIVNREGWSPLNALQIIVRDNNPEGHFERMAKSIDSGAANKAVLHIEWLKST